MKHLAKYSLWIIGIIIMVMMLLNPTPASFREYAKGSEHKPYFFVYKRKANFLIFSIYVREGQKGYWQGAYDFTDQNSEYLGIIANFFELAETSPSSSIAQPRKADQTKNVDPDLGFNAHVWADDLNSYVDKNPNVSDTALFKLFPGLKNSSYGINCVLAYGQAKTQGLSEDQLKKLFPELYKYP